MANNRFIFPVGGTPESVRAQLGAVGPAPEPGSVPAPSVGEVLTWDGAQWVPGPGGGGGGVTSVTASAPLASSGGATPDISISAGTTPGDVMTWDGANWAGAAPAGGVWSKTGTELSPATAGDTVQIEIPVGTTGLTVEDTPASLMSEVRPGVLYLTDNVKVAELNTVSASLLLKGDSGEAIPVVPTITAQDYDSSPTPLDLVVGELRVNGAPGAAGEVLTSNGPGAAPTWQAGGGAGLGSKVLLCVQGGSYATIQAAIDAASDWDVILVGPKAAGASWGPMTFSPGKRLVVASLGSKWSTQVRVDSITFNADSGLNILENTVFVRGLFINSSFTALAPGVNFYGSAPARLRLQECFIYNSNAATGTGVVSNNSGSGSSLYIDNCIVQSGASTGIGVDHQQGYTIIRGDSEISRYQYQVQCARPGLPVSNVEITNTLLDGTGAANEVIRITGGTVTCGYSTIKNATTNASGVNLTAAGAAFGAGDATFAIATGTGYCVRGVVNSVYLYGNVTYSNSTAAAYNTKVQTGSPANPAAFLAAIPVAQAFTNSA
jgi:hypothetical protein